MTVATRTVASCLRKFSPSFREQWRPWNNLLKIIERQFCISKPVNSDTARDITRRVKSYGKLFIDVPWNVEVKPTDPHDYPNMDTVIVKVSSSRGYDKEIEKFLIIDVSDDLCKITAKRDEKFDFSNGALCLVEVPVRYDIDARASGDSGVSISGMVSDLIKAQTERGYIEGEKLRGNKIKLNSSQGGSVELRKSLQGDIEIKTAKNGSIRAEKCSGTSLVITTENGDVSLGSNYSERAIFTTENGNMSLNNLHADASVDISGRGSLDIPCLDGSLRARLRDGDARIHVARLTGKSEIISNGPVNLTLPRENNIRLSLKGGKLSLDESFRGTGAGDERVFETSGEIPLRVETRGDVRVTGSSWAESLQLGKFGK